jgi:transposase
MDKFIGFDIDHKNTVACITAAGQPERYSRLRTDVTELREWLKNQRGPGDRLHLTFEVSGLSGHLYDGLVDVVDRLEVSNPSKLTWIYRSTQKNDRMDSRKQAVLMRVGELPRVHMPSREVRDWRGQIQHRRKLVECSSRIKCRIRALIKSRGLSKLHPGGWWNGTNRHWMRELSKGVESWHYELADLLDELELYEKQARRVTGALDELLKQMPAAKVLRTIAGVGPRTIEAVLAYTDGVRRFRRGKQYGAYFGLTPKLDESGSRRRLGHISKQGPSVVRWLIVESAWRVVRYSPAMRSFFERVQHGQKGRKKIAIVATARKLLTIMRAMLKSGQAYNEALAAKS